MDSAKSTATVENINAAVFSEKLKNDPSAVLIDVRTEGEFNMGHIPTALLVDIMSPDFIQEINKMDKSKNYYLYCRSGNRSYHAGMAMIRMGFGTVFNLEDGILEWYEPLEKGA